MNTFSIDDQLVFIIDRLNTAINVCHEAPENEDQGYAYATGYSRSAMSDTADDLSKIVEQIRKGWFDDYFQSTNASCDETMRRSRYSHP